MNDAQIIIEVKSPNDGARVIKRDLDQISNSGDKATVASAKLERQMRSTAGAAQMLSRAFGMIIGVIGIRELARMSDTMSVLQGRLDNATRSATESAQAFDGLRRIAMTTGSSLDAAVSIFQRLSFVRDEIHATASEMLIFTDTVSKLGVISGASTDALKFGLTQLGQGLSSNILRAEEFNSIMENIPAVGKAIADQFGVTTGQLRQLVIEGEVLSKDVFAAVLLSTEQANENFEKMPLTFARAAAVIGASFQGIFVDIEKTTGASDFLANSMLKVADIVAGLGKIFVGAANIAQVAFKTVVGSLYDLFASFANFAFTTLNDIIAFANRIPGVDIDKIPLHDRDKFNKNLRADIGNDLSEASKAFSEAGGAFLGNNSAATLGEQEKSAREISKNYEKIVKSLSASDEATKKAKKSQDELTSAIKASRTEEEKLLDEIARMENMRGLAKATGQSQELEQAIARANGELNDMRIQTEREGPLAKGFEALTKQVDDGIRDAFRDAATSAGGIWDGLIDGMKASFKTLLADLAYMAVARPIVLSVLGGVGGAMGLSGAANASILGDIGGGGLGSMFSGGNLGSILSNSWSAISNGLNSPIFGAGSMIGGGINSIGAALGLNNGSFIGPMMPGTSNLASAFTPTAGLAGLGGNLLANALFGGDRGWGSTIGGTLGSLGGTAVGASMGTILGMAGGPVGALIGGFAGNALGGLFGGGGIPRVTIGGGFQYDDNGLLSTVTNPKDEERDQSQAWLDQVTQILNAINSTAGIQANIPTGGWFESNIGKKDPGTFFKYRTGSKTKLSSGLGDIDSVVQYILNSGFTGGNEDINAVLNKSLSMKSSSQQLLDDVGLAKMIYGGDETDQAAEAIAKALEEVNDHFDALYERAAQLGLPLSEVTEALEKQKDAAIKAVEAQEGLVKAMQAGFQSMEAMKATFDGWLYDQSLSSTSSLSPAEKLAAAQGNFGDLLTKAQGGDYSVTQALLQAGQQLLTIGQGMYASSVDFAVLEQFVRSSITQIAKDLDIPGYATGTNSARRGRAWVGENGPEIVDFNGGERVYNAEQSKGMMRQYARQEADIGSMKEYMAGMSENMLLMGRQINRLTNKLVNDKSVASV